MYTTETKTNPLMRHPILATGSIGILAIGLLLALLGLSFYVIGWAGALTAQASVLPATSVQQVLAERQMLFDSGLWLATAGVPFLLVGMILIAIVWLIL